MNQYETTWFRKITLLVMMILAVVSLLAGVSPAVAQAAPDKFEAVEDYISSRMEGLVQDNPLNYQDQSKFIGSAFKCFGIHTRDVLRNIIFAYATLAVNGRSTCRSRSNSSFTGSE